MRSKILPILTTMVWLLAGCSKAVDEPVVQQPVSLPVAQEPEPENVPIDFSAQVMDHVTTRSGSTPTAVYGDYFNVSTEKYKFTEGYTSATQLKTSETPSETPDGFGVFAYFTGNSNFGTGAAAPEYDYERQVVMWNQKVTSTDGTTWTYTPKRYWPANAAKMSFFAYAPYMDGSYIENPKAAQIISITTEGAEKYSYLAKNNFVAPSIKYTWSHTNPIDLMWGTAREDAYDVNGDLIKHEGDDYTDMRRPNNNKLKWNFKHVLSRIKFYIANYLSTDKMLDQVEAIGFVNAKTVKCLIDEEYVPGKNKRGWYISFSDDGGAGDYNIWNKIKELDMRMMITGVKISGFYGNRVLELMNDGKNAKWEDGVKYGSNYELRPLNPNICADIPSDKVEINGKNILVAKSGYVLEDVINSLASFNIDYGEGIYDISAEAGKDYLNLGVALEDVPNESKVMGMSVRFINSLKDKYEQYKYKGATIEDVNFNNVANWEQEEEGTLEIPLNIALTIDDDEDNFKHYLLLIPQEADFDDIGNNIKVEVDFRIITHVQFEETTFDWEDKNVVDFVPFAPPAGASIYPRNMWVSTQDPSSMYGYIMKDLQSNKSYKVVIRLGKVMSILYEITDWDDNYEITIPSFE